MDKLLLIDDEADVQYSFRRNFGPPEFELTTAASGEEGLKIIPKLNPDLVIMDVRMGGMTGLETLRLIRESDARLPVIMMTAYGTTRTCWGGPTTSAVEGTYCLTCECYLDGAIPADDAMTVDRPRQVAFPACSTRGAVGGSGPT